MPSIQNLLATMITTTTYGMWPPGDLRGYVDDGIILPGDPMLLARSRELMNADPIFLTAVEQEVAFEALRSAAAEFQYVLLAVSIEPWHAHWLIDHAFDDVEAMVGRLKTRMRQAVNRGRIWTEGYDSRYCFDQDALARRHQYIIRHRGWRPLPHQAPCEGTPLGLRAAPEAHGIAAAHKSNPIAPGTAGILCER